MFFLLPGQPWNRELLCCPWVITLLQNQLYVPAFSDDLTKQAIVPELFLNKRQTSPVFSYLAWDSVTFINMYSFLIIFSFPLSHRVHFLKIVFLLQACICAFVWSVLNPSCFKLGPVPMSTHTYKICISVQHKWRDPAQAPEQRCIGKEHGGSQAEGAAGVLCFGCI